MLIGEMSRRSGVKVPTIRYYEGIGLLPPPARTEGRQRDYDPTHLDRLAFIRHARSLGFELDAIRELLDLSENPDQPCEAADLIARRHLVEVDSRLAKLEALKAELSRMIEACRHGTVGHCKIIQVLSDNATDLDTGLRSGRAPKADRKRR